MPVLEMPSTRFVFSFPCAVARFWADFGRVSSPNRHTLFPFWRGVPMDKGLG